MASELERETNRDYRSRLKSIGERKIAYFLDGNNIQYQYESPALVKAYDLKFRIWYPDFFLPEFNTYIEYFGIVGDHNYDMGVKKKELTYLESGLDVISVFPTMFKGNWQAYIMNGLKSNVLRRYRSLMNKPYWSRSRPY